MKIAFGDKSRVGKDTCVNYLIKTYGGQHLSFAEDLYKILYYAQEVCGFKKSKDRKFLQFIGTDWAREIDNNIWINLTLKKAEVVKGNLFISDVRFRNEFDALKKEGWTLVKIIKDNPEVTGGILNHSSEKNDIKDDEWDYIINNNESIEDLYCKLEDIIKQLFFMEKKH